MWRIWIVGTVWLVRKLELFGKVELIIFVHSKARRLFYFIFVFFIFKNLHGLRMFFFGLNCGYLIIQKKRIVDI